MKHTLSQLRSGALQGTTRLNLSCGLHDFPAEIYDLADTLEILDLSGNALSALPHDLHRLHRLRVLFCSDNQFTSVPEVLGACVQLSMVGFKSNQIHTLPGAAIGEALRWLILTDNQLSELPAELGRCTHLQKLMLSGNRLQSLPETMVACTSLELLRIASNRFEQLPGWLLQLPKLAWLAYAGNPLSDHGMTERQAVADAGLDRISWRDLHLQQQLGQGASGVIHQAIRQDITEHETVAVKLFKSAVTSDGLPQSEMAACAVAGHHPNLIGVVGMVRDHPENAEGLIMSLIAPEFRNLADPPSLDSCTRDIYAADAQFTIDAVIKIAHGIASAAAHLHAKGLMHGDLYAHNILYDGDGNCLLGDFGAASFVTNDPAYARKLQGIEVRAFACLLEELLARCVGVNAEGIMLVLRQLQQQCAHSEVAQRPLFSQIELALAAL